MKKLLFVLSFLVSVNTCFSQSTKIPESLSDAKWKETKISGVLIANDDTKTEVIFDTHLPTSIREVGEGGIVYTVKGSTKILRSIGDEYKSFQIDDKVFERSNLTLKSGKKIKFMQPLAKGKIDMYLYIYRSSITMVNDVAKDIPSYYISYFLRKNSSKEESIANETMGTDKSVALLFDNEQVKGDYDYKQYGVLGEKEGVVKGLDLLKMVKDYNAAK